MNMMVMVTVVGRGVLQVGGGMLAGVVNEVRNAPPGGCGGRRGG